VNRLFLLATCSFIGAISVARASNVAPLMREAANEILHEGSPGVAMAVVADGQVTYYNAGSSERPKLPITNQTLFEVASITKVFTTTLLGIDVVRGDKSLNSPVQKYLPGYKLRPKFKRATLKMLGTFTADLPETPPDMARLPEKERGIDHYSVKRFLRYISHFSPEHRLPGPRAYGDASVGLLGLALSNLNIDILEERFHKEIFDPLGMHDTAMRLRPDQEQRLAFGRRPGKNGLADRWPVDAIAAADAEKSTTYDMAQFLLASLGQKPDVPSDLAAGMGIATKARFPVHFQSFTEFQSLAWRRIPVAVGKRHLWFTTKSGDLPGYSSEISYSPDLGVGVVIFANLSQLDLTDIETDLMKRVAARTP
jgi:beta-lactamase class C